MNETIIYTKDVTPNRLVACLKTCSHLFDFPTLQDSASLYHTWRHFTKLIRHIDNKYIGIGTTIVFAPDFTAIYDIVRKWHFSIQTIVLVLMLYQLDISAKSVHEASLDQFIFECETQSVINHNLDIIYIVQLLQRLPLIELIHRQGQQIHLAATILNDSMERLKRWHDMIYTARRLRYTQARVENIGGPQQIPHRIRICFFNKMEDIILTNITIEAKITMLQWFHNLFQAYNQNLNTIKGLDRDLRNTRLDLVTIGDVMSDDSVTHLRNAIMHAFGVSDMRILYARLNKGVKLLISSHQKLYAGHGKNDQPLSFFMTKYLPSFKLISPPTQIDQYLQVRQEARLKASV